MQHLLLVLTLIYLAWNWRRVWDLIAQMGMWLAAAAPRVLFWYLAGLVVGAIIYVGDWLIARL